MIRYAILLTLVFLQVGYCMAGKPKEPLNILKMGAIADGTTLNTQIIQKAIDDVSKDGGGTIFFPKGKYLTGSIMLKSNVTLDIEEGAFLLGSTNPYDYYAPVMSNKLESPKKDDKSSLALIMSDNAINIGLIGKGTIDGQGLALALNVDSLHHAGVRIDPNYNTRRMRPSELFRPKLFRFSSCSGVTVKNLHLRNSACWGLSFELCSNMVLDSLNIFNRAYWNNDGMDITDCRNVRVTNCYIDSADDAICLKSYYPGHWNDSIYIANCEARSSASAVKFGTASYGGFKNITIENIKVFDTFRSAIAIQAVDGGDVENISISNIVAVNTGNAIFIRLGHRDGAKPGTVKNVHIKNVKVQVPFDRPDINYDLRGPEVGFFHNPFPASIVGIPGHNVENVTLENIEITYPGRGTKGMAYIPVNSLGRVPEEIRNYPEFSMFGELPAWAFYVRHARGITMNNISVKVEAPDYRPAFVFDDVQSLNLSGINVAEDKNDKQYILRNVTDSDLQVDKQRVRIVE